MGSKKKDTSKNTTGKTNRLYKDTIFADLFGNDIHAEENVISLVNALYGTNLKKGQVKYKKENLESVLRVTDLRNDVSFMLDDKLLVLFEHQSSINENMPVRCLMYCSELYKRMVPGSDYFARLRMKLPMPQFFVFYNGNENISDDFVLKLSDSFMLDEGDKAKAVTDKSHSYLELTVRVLNINSERNADLLKNCEILRQYSEFTRLMKEQHLRYSKGKETDEERKQREDENLIKMKYVVDYCIENNILKEYFTRKGREVYAMLKMEYSREYELECTRKFMQKLQDRADRAEEEKAKAEKEKAKAEKEKAKAEKEKAKAEEEKAKAEKGKAKLEKEKAKLEETIANNQLVMYHQTLNFEIFLINSGKGVEEIRPIAGCTEPYIEMIYSIVKENSNITAEQLYDEAIKDEIDKQSKENKKEQESDKEE